jgi:DNA-binding MarR family transcriptional regulator
VTLIDGGGSTKHVDAAPAGAPAVAQGAPAEGAPAEAEQSAAEIATRLRAATTRLGRRLRQHSLAGLSPAQASVLATVSRLESPTLGELATAEQVQPPTVTKLVATMEHGGLLLRRTDPVDRRVVRVRLSSEGRRTLQRVRSLKTAFLTRQLMALPETERREAAHLVELLERLTGEP